jgi:hypothetical protein
MFASPHSHPQLQALEAIQPPHVLAIHEPAIASQQYSDPEISEARPDMGQIVNAEPETGLILGATPSIPGGATELGQSAGPQATDLESVLQPTSQFASAGGPQTFFRRASDSMGLSNERSATNRFNRLFSSSSGRRRRSSLTPRWADFFFHA